MYFPAIARFEGACEGVGFSMREIILWRCLSISVLLTMPYFVLSFFSISWRPMIGVCNCSYCSIS